ncbi:MAG: hypothetical protein MRY83_09220 [Flavobacteriales bacterium]|nr:hypothetical protein [Flavobacteriales bacterium]
MIKLVGFEDVHSVDLIVSTQLLPNQCSPPFPKNNSIVDTFQLNFDHTMIYLPNHYNWGQYGIIRLLINDSLEYQLTHFEFRNKVKKELFRFSEIRFYDDNLRYRPEHIVSEKLILKK